MALLPPSMQDKTEFMPLGKAIQKPEPVKADPVRDFEKHNHDIPGAKLPRVTPEMAARALRSLCAAGAMIHVDGRIVLGPTSVEFEGGGFGYIAQPSTTQSLLTWPTLPDLPEPTFLPEVVNEAPSRDTEPLGDLSAKIKEAEERARVGSMVLEVERRLATYGIARLNIHDMNAIREWFGPLDIPAAWLGKIAYSSEFQRMSI